MFTFSPLQITLARSVSDVQQEIISTQNQLAAGKRNLNAGEYGIVTRLSSQASAQDTATKNITSAKNILNVGQTSLTSIASIVSQLRELATQGSSAGLTQSDRESMGSTFASLYARIATLSSAASINGNNIINAATAVEVLYSPGTAVFSMTGQNVPAASALATVSAAVVGTAASTTFSAANAVLAAAELVTLLDSISTKQGNLTSYSIALDAMSEGGKGISAGLNSTVDSIQGIDSTALQTKLQSLNNQQSIDYYLVSQMNTASAALLAIFR